MDRALVLLLLLLSISQISTASSRVLLGDEVPGKNNSEPEIARAKDEVEKPSLVSHTNEPSNQSKLAPPISVVEDKETQEPAPPAGKEKTTNPEKGNHTVLAPPVSQEIIKSTNSTVERGAGTDMTGTETDTGPKKDDNVSKINGLCDLASEKCSNKDNWIACLQHPSNDSKEIFLVVGNKGGNDISFDVKSSPSIVLDSKMLNLAKHDIRKVNILISDTNHAADITISAGTSTCILHVKPATATFDWQKPVQQFASYATQLTPIYGAYVLLFAIGISLITWVCCKFIRGKRLSNSGPTYQQLEMGGVQETQSNSVNADATNTDDGWENGWDDNWDDEEAVLGKPVSTSGVSADGLSSRSYNNNNSKDGWEVDWDD